MTLLHVRTHHLHRRSIGGDSGGSGSADLELAAALARADLPEPNGVWFIDRIDVRSCGRADLGARSTADLIARQIARQVRAVLDDAPGQDGVRWFPDRAAYLAQWLVDLSTGHAADRWEYAQFGTAGVSAALRERADAEPATVLAALHSLPAAELDRMIGLLTPADASAIVHAVATGTGSADRAALARAVALLGRAGRLPRDTQRATAVVLLHPDTGGDHPGPVDAAAARGLVLLYAALRDGDPARRDALVSATRTADARTLAALGHAELAAALASWSRGDRAAAVRALTPDRAADAAPGPDRTLLGGMFLLLPLLQELPGPTPPPAGPTRRAPTRRRWPALSPAARRSASERTCSPTPGCGSHSVCRPIPGTGSSTGAGG
ncbi:hypothetical protein [Flexivirga alba]|uniref:DUF4192 family protein n=1 Tax=Flexivirga alba TaxID=702742 RepID=A0ABW2AG19_9MICO